MKKILIVSELRSLVEKEKSILNRSDFNIFSAASGREAFDIHKSEKVDLIVADNDLPDITGDDLCSMIRDNEELRKVSIILLFKKTDIEKNLHCKANAFVAKPLDPPALLEKVSHLLSIAQRKSYRVLLKISVNGKFMDKPFYCTSKDISAAGMLLETEKRLEKGDVLSCSFFLPGSQQIVTDAEVVRVINKLSETAHYGVKFLNLPAECTSAIEKFIRKRAEG